MDLAELAALFRVTEKAVRDWVYAGLPVVQKGTQGGSRKKTRISLKAAIEWYFRENFERLELDRQRTELAKEQASKVGLENAERRGDLARISVLEKAFSDAVTVAQSKLLAIPSKEAPMLAPLTDANAIEQRLTAAVHDALNELAAYGARGKGVQSGGRSHNGAVRATTKANGKRVGRAEPATQ